MARRSMIPAVALLALVALVALGCSDDEKSDDTTTTSVAASSTTSSTEPEDNPEARVFTQPGETIEVSVGERFVIELDGNPSTGYTWSPTEAVNPAVLEFAGTSFTSSTPGMPGAPGKEQLEYIALGVGEDQITLAYQRPWETDQPPQDTATFTVKVAA